MHCQHCSNVLESHKICMIGLTGKYLGIIINIAGYFQAKRASFFVWVLSGPWTNHRRVSFIVLHCSDRYNQLCHYLGWSVSPINSIYKTFFGSNSFFCVYYMPGTVLSSTGM